MHHPDTYRIDIDGRWSLEDLYVFPRNYEQVYFAIEALTPNSTLADDERIRRAFSAYPWRGGYSAVNFYNQLKYATPKKQRPEIISIKYASPGAIELGLIIPVALSVAYTVKKFASSLDKCNETYNNLYTHAKNRKLLSIEVEHAKLALAKDQIEFIEFASSRMTEILSLPNASFVHERTQNPLISLKMLFSLFRRVRTLAEYQNKDKIDLNSGTGDGRTL